MLKKLFKYDIRAIFKYWWIVALSSIGISIVGGISLRALISLIPKEEPSGIEAWILLFSILGIFLAIIGLSAFLISSEIFLYVRLYKHLFSDEGYLTFTLPVKRRDILNSKILSGLVIKLATLAVIILDIAVIFLVGVDHESISKALSVIGVFIEKLFSMLGFVSVAYIAEALILTLCLSVSSYLMIAFCMTFAAVIAKKYKLFAAIGIYYIVTAVISFAAQFMLMFGVVGFAGLFDNIPPESISGVFALIIFSACALIAAITYGLYTLELYLLEKKLNLS